MKRFAWLLAGIYAVYPTKSMDQCWEIRKSTSSAITVCDKEMAFDMAELLNEAHERRTANQPPKKKIGFDTSTDDFSGKKP